MVKYMKWLELNKEKSSEKYDLFIENGSFECPEEYSDLQKDLRDAFITTLSEIGIDPEDINSKNNSYKVDYIYGMKIYMLFIGKYGMSVRTAACDGVWRYLSLCVVPDIVEMRYGKDHPDRFWKKAKRIWLRVIWWYIYLSWQGDEEQTKRVLKDNSTDEILQLVDRCGRGGYRVDLYRAFMKKYSEMDVSERRKNQIFRKMMVLNTARVQVIEPGLVDGGEAKYVDDLCSYFMK